MILAIRMGNNEIVVFFKALISFDAPRQNILFIKRELFGKITAMTTMRCYAVDPPSFGPGNILYMRLKSTKEKKIQTP